MSLTNVQTQECAHTNDGVTVTEGSICGYTTALNLMQVLAAGCGVDFQALNVNRIELRDPQGQDVELNIDDLNSFRLKFFYQN